jgi:hypothetical protein
MVQFHRISVAGGCTTEEPFEVALRLLEVNQEVSGSRTQTGTGRLSGANPFNFVDCAPTRSLEPTRSIPFGAHCPLKPLQCLCDGLTRKGCTQGCETLSEPAIYAQNHHSLPFSVHCHWLPAFDLFLALHKPYCRMLSGVIARLSPPIARMFCT